MKCDHACLQQSPPGRAPMSCRDTTVGPRGPFRRWCRFVSEQFAGHQGLIDHSGGAGALNVLIKCHFEVKKRKKERERIGTVASYSARERAAAREREREARAGDAAARFPCLGPRTDSQLCGGYNDNNSLLDLLHTCHWAQSLTVASVFVWGFFFPTWGKTTTRTSSVGFFFPAN